MVNISLLMMKQPINQLIAILLTCLVIVSGAAPAAPLFGDDDTLWRSAPNQYIKYTKQDDSSYGKNDHPVELDPRKIATVLESLKTRSDDYFASDEETEPVFSVSQAQRLGTELAKGLKNAKPDQDIVFVLEKSITHLLFFTEQVFLAGRAFYKDGQLNIIIGDYDKFRNEELEKVYDSSGQLGAPYSFNHGFRTSSSGNFKQNIVANAGVNNKVLDNKVRKDWIVMDLDKAVAAIDADKRRQGQQQGTDTAAARQMRLEAARMQKEQRELKLEMARMREQMKSMDGGSGSAGGETVEERLTTLEKLYEQELISKEEYEAKRQQILSDI